MYIGIKSNMERKYDNNLIAHRKKNALRMTLTGFVYVVVSILCPFIIRSMMIYIMGYEYAGLNTVLYSIISMLNMTELGLGSVIVYFLYDPVARGDIKRIGAYLRVLKKVYGYIAAIVSLIGICVIPFIKYIVGVDVPADSHVYASYLLFLVSTIVLYLGMPEADILFNAYQRGDIVNYIKLLSALLAYTLQIIAIVVFRSFVMYFCAILLQSLFVVFLRYYSKKKYFPQISSVGDISSEEKRDIRKRVLSVFGHQMDETLISSMDNLILSFFCGLSVVTTYGNYMYVVSALGMFLAVLFNALTVTVGNAIVTESKESNYIRFKKVLGINSALVIWIFVCMSNLYTELTAWMGDKLLPFRTMFLFCIYFFVMQIRKSVISFKNANGMWWEDRYKPYLSMIVNIILDIILVRFAGIEGALLSSILCIVFIEIPWESKVLIRDYFNQSLGYYYVKLLEGLLLCVAGSFIAGKACELIDTGIMLGNIAIHGIICTLIFVIFLALVMLYSNVVIRHEES